MTRVMVIGSTELDSFADNVGDTLRRMGHEVRMTGAVRPRHPNRHIADAAETLSDRVKRFDSRLQKHLISTARDFGPDVIITLDRRIQPTILRELKTGGARAALWFPDAVSNLGRHDLFLAPYDRIFFKNPRLVEQLSEVHGLPAAYLPEAANSTWHRSMEPYGRDPVAVIAGSIHPTRGILLERLAAAGIPLRIYGPPPAPWMNFPAVQAAHTGGFVYRTAKADVFRRARFVLNDLHPAEFAGTNRRLFEAASAGAAVLTENREGLREIFDTGAEVLTFDSFEQLREIAQRLFNDQNFGRQVGNRAALRVQRDHTYEQRLIQLLSSLE